jgi:hypothetical protein
MIVFQGGRRMENISLMIKIGKQQAFFIDARKNEREREKALFSSKRRNLNNFPQKKAQNHQNASSC